MRVPQHSWCQESVLAIVCGCTCPSRLTSALRLAMRSSLSRWAFSARSLAAAWRVSAVSWVSKAPRRVLGVHADKGAGGGAKWAREDGRSGREGRGGEEGRGPSKDAKWKNVKQAMRTQHHQSRSRKLGMGGHIPGGG